MKHHDIPEKSFAGTAMGGSEDAMAISNQVADLMKEKAALNINLSVSMGLPQGDALSGPLNGMNKNFNDKFGSAEDLLIKTLPGGSAEQNILAKKQLAMGKEFVDTPPLKLNSDDFAAQKKNVVADGGPKLPPNPNTRYEL